jgi:orotate phosphoribosyltransferase
VYLRRVEALYEALLREGIVQLRGEAPFFRWASGRLSPIYLDFRRCLAYPTLRRALVEGLLAHLREGHAFFRAVAGVATGGISWAAWIAERLDLPMGYVRNTPKTHGTSQIVEGLLPQHSPVLLIEDVLSTGQSTLTAAAHLQREGFTLAAIAVLWDYDLPQRQAIPYPTYSVLHFLKALQVWQPHLSPSHYQLLKTWHETGELPA